VDTLNSNYSVRDKTVFASNNENPCWQVPESPENKLITNSDFWLFFVLLRLAEELLS
jgi:hypothetical protein